MIVADNRDRVSCSITSSIDSVCTKSTLPQWCSLIEVSMHAFQGSH